MSNICILDTLHTSKGVSGFKDGNQKNKKEK
jgi:hypothetical protein